MYQEQIEVLTDLWIFFYKTGKYCVYLKIKIGKKEATGEVPFH